MDGGMGMQSAHLPHTFFRRSHIAAHLATSNCTPNDEWFRTRQDCEGERFIGRLMRNILLANKVS
jgi:hypothetical protein